MEHEPAKPRARRRRTGPWWLLVAGLVLGALAVTLLVVPLDEASSSSTSIPAGSIDASGAELTAVLGTPAAGRAVAAAADVPARGLGPALEARRGRAGAVVVEYQAERSIREMRRITTAAARFLADAIDVSARREAEQRVVAAETRSDRAAALLDAHETDTGIADPDDALTASEQRLASLQAQRDQAVAAGSALVPSLEQQVASAQQEMFDLEAVSTRRAELLDGQRRADGAVADAEAALQLASDRVGSGAARAPSVTVHQGTTDLPLWRVVAAGILLVLAAGAVSAGVIGLRRSRRRRPRVRTTVQTRRSVPGVADQVAVSSATPGTGAGAAPVPDGSAAEAPRIELDEIERRLAELERPTVGPGDVDEDPRIDH